jgi:hypothetical protein
MSSYITRWCAIHGEWDDDVDLPSECPECLEAGTAPIQLEAREKASLRAELAEKDENIAVMTDVVGSLENGVQQVIGPFTLPEEAEVYGEHSAKPNFVMAVNEPEEWRPVIGPDPRD